MKCIGTVRASSIHVATTQRTIGPAHTQSNKATPALPADRKTLTGWVKIPLAMVLFITKQKTENGLIFWFPGGAMMTSFFGVNYHLLASIQDFQTSLLGTASS